MDSRTGEIHRFNQEMIDKLTKSGEIKHMIPLTDKQADDLASLSPIKRKGNMRNQRCPCGSGAKFKRCCWSKYE